jgi:hypothetical protein
MKHSPHDCALEFQITESLPECSLCASYESTLATTARIFALYQK